MSTRLEVIKGRAYVIYLTSGKRFYTFKDSEEYWKAKLLGLTIDIVEFEGCCLDYCINSRAHSGKDYPIEIDGISIYTYLDSVAKEDEEIK